MALSRLRSLRVELLPPGAAHDDTILFTQELLYPLHCWHYFQHRAYIKIIFQGLLISILLR